MISPASAIRWLMTFTSTPLTRQVLQGAPNSSGGVCLSTAFHWRNIWRSSTPVLIFGALADAARVAFFTTLVSRKDGSIARRRCSSRRAARKPAGTSTRHHTQNGPTRRPKDPLTQTPPPLRRSTQGTTPPTLSHCELEERAVPRIATVTRNPHISLWSLIKYRLGGEKIGCSAL